MSPAWKGERSYLKEEPDRRVGRETSLEVYYFLFEALLTYNIVLGLGVQHNDLKYVCIVK